MASNIISISFIIYKIKYNFNKHAHMHTYTYTYICVLGQTIYLSTRHGRIGQGHVEKKLKHNCKVGNDHITKAKWMTSYINLVEFPNSYKESG